MKHGVTEPGPSGLTAGPAAEPPGPPEYLAYYGLSRTPFSASAAPERAWLGASHQRLLARLAEAIQAGTGIILLTGDVGSGKTSLASGLLESLGSDRITAVRVAGSGPEIGDFYQTLARACGLPVALDTADTFTPALADLVGRAGRERRTVLLVLDEAQQLGFPHLDAVRDLSAAAGGSGGGLVVLLVGQSELRATLLLERHAELAERIGARFAVEPLTPDEVGEYIRHRLHTAGCRRELFSADAIREIARLSRGTPAVINALCDRALLTGHRRQAQTLRRHSIEDCWSGLGAPEPARDRPSAEGPRVRRGNGRAHARARARPRRPQGEGRPTGGRRIARRAVKALVAAVAGVLLVMGGYSLYSGRARDRAHAPAPPPVTTAEPRVEPAAAAATTPPDQGTPSPPVTAGTAPPPAEDRPAAARPAAPSPSRAARAARGADPEGAARRPAAPAAGTTAMPRDPGAASKLDEALRTAPGPGAASPEGRGPGEARAAEGSRDEAPDAGSVIDWLLTEYPRKSR